MLIDGGCVRNARRHAIALRPRCSGNTGEIGDITGHERDDARAGEGDETGQCSGEQPQHNGTAGGDVGELLADAIGRKDRVHGKS